MALRILRVAIGRAVGQAHSLLHGFHCDSNSGGVDVFRLLSASLELVFSFGWLSVV